MKTFVIQTSDSINAEQFKQVLMELKAVKNVQFFEKENWQIPGRPATEKELEAMAIEAEESGFILIEDVKASFNKLHSDTLKTKK